MTTPTMSPWGPVQSSEILADGVVFVSADHEGLHLTPEISGAIPLEIARSFMNGPAWPERDAEMPIALALLIDAGEIPEGAAARFVSPHAARTAGSLLGALALHAVHKAAEAHAYPAAVRHLLRILAKTRARNRNAPGGGPPEKVEVTLEKDAKDALLTLREYALTFSAHPDKTTANGAAYIVENAAEAVKFGVKLAADLLTQHGHVADPNAFGNGTENPPGNDDAETSEEKSSP